MKLDTWIGIDFKYLALILFFVVGYYVNNFKDKVADLENEIENLKFDIKIHHTGFTIGFHPKVSNKIQAPMMKIFSAFASQSNQHLHP